MLQSSVEHNFDRLDPLCLWRKVLAVWALTLLIACGGGGSTDNSAINLPPVPILSASIDASIAQPLTGQEVRLSPSVSLSTTTVSPTLTVTQVVWDFGDGSPVVSISNAASFTVPQYKSYSQTGTYIVTLSATDSAGRSGSVTRTIAVQSSAATGLLNDTGIQLCREFTSRSATWASVPCFVINVASDLFGTIQDAALGRDAQAIDRTLTKKGSGQAGFDFTRLGADGQALAIQTATYSATGNQQDGTQWDCIKDNQTGLIWEIKRMDDPTHLRHVTATFSWYNPDNTENGGLSGGIFGGVCNGVANTTQCNTQAYTSAINSLPVGQALCGFRDWRMPSREELSGIANLGSSYALDSQQFPDFIGLTWSASAYSLELLDAWVVDFTYGNSFAEKKTNAHSIRLVRSGQ